MNAIHPMNNPDGTKWFDFSSQQLNELMNSDQFKWMADTRPNKDFRDLLIDNGLNIRTMELPFKEFAAEATVDDMAVFLTICREEEKRSSNQLISQDEIQEALPFARSEAHLDAVLEAGAQINAVDGEGDTALHVAAYRGYGDVVEWLVDRGADVQAVDTNGLLASERASEEGETKIHDYLRLVETSQVADALNQSTVQAGSWSPSSADAEALMPAPVVANATQDASTQQRSRRL